MIRLIECEQGTEEWLRARMGMPTASELATVMANGKDGGASKTRRTYMLKLAGEILTGLPMDSYTNAHMERGKAMEEEAREYYLFVTGSEPTRVGFAVNDDLRCGCSPDSLIGDSGMLEVKTKQAHLLIELRLKDEFPPEHKAQCQGGLWVLEREWIDLVVYWPGLPMFKKRAVRDEAYIKNLSGEVARFNDELQEIVAKLRARDLVKPPLDERIDPKTLLPMFLIRRKVA